MKATTSMPDEHNKPPETIKEVGIHLSYMSQAIDDLKRLVKDQGGNYATRSEMLSIQQRADEKHLEHEKAIQQLEDWNTWAIRIVVGAVITAVIGLVVYVR